MAPILFELVTKGQANPFRGEEVSSGWPLPQQKRPSVFPPLP